MYSFYESVRSKEYGRTSSNMYLQYKWDMENLANHRYKVKTAKPSIDNEAPLTYTHMFVRPKKLQLELERYSTIQRNNRFLLERLAKIEREGAWIDNKNVRQSRSLNTWKRQQEMIQLAHNNQIMIARLQDVKSQHNRTKLEDEYLINQKYKANIQKWPPNWKELQQHLNRVKADIFKKVFDSKYQTETLRKTRKRDIEKWTLEKEKHRAAKAEKDAEKAVQAEKRIQIEKEKQKLASKERKKALEKWLKSSEKWRSARDKRLKSIAKEEKRKVEEAEQKKREIQDTDIKRRQKERENLEKWIRGKKEKQEQQKKEKKAKETLKKDYVSSEKLLKDKSKYSIESTGFDVESDDREDDYGERKESSISDFETMGLKKETTSIDPTIKKSEQDTSAKRALMDGETEKIISDERIQKTEQTTFGGEAHMTQKTTSKHKDPTSDESVPGHGKMTDKKVGLEETPTAEQITSSQEIPTKDISDVKIPTTTVSDDKTISEEEGSSYNETISESEGISDDETSPDDESSIREENISDEESHETQNTTSELTGLTSEESVRSHEKITEKKVDSEEETPTEEQITPSQEIPTNDISDVEVPITTVPDDETISENETIPPDDETIPDDESSITEENISDEESLTTSKTSDEEPL